MPAMFAAAAARAIHASSKQIIFQLLDGLTERILELSSLKNFSFACRFYRKHSKNDPRLPTDMRFFYRISISNTIWDDRPTNFSVCTFEVHSYSFLAISGGGVIPPLPPITLVCIQSFIQFTCSFSTCSLHIPSR